MRPLEHITCAVMGAIAGLCLFMYYLAFALPW